MRVEVNTAFREQAFEDFMAGDVLVSVASQLVGLKTVQGGIVWLSSGKYTASCDIAPRKLFAVPNRVSFTVTI